jgi:hypothetical protein
VQLPTDIGKQIDRGVVQVELTGKHIVCAAQRLVTSLAVACTRAIHGQGLASKALKTEPHMN